MTVHILTLGLIILTPIFMTNFVFYFQVITMLSTLRADLIFQTRFAIVKGRLLLFCYVVSKCVA